MAIFEIKDNKVKRIKPTEFKLEKDLQNLVEQNLVSFFNCRFVASKGGKGTGSQCIILCCFCGIWYKNDLGTVKKGILQVIILNRSVIIVNEKYKQLFIFHQFGGVRKMNIYKLDGKAELRKSTIIMQEDYLKKCLREVESKVGITATNAPAQRKLSRQGFSFFGKSV